MIRATSICHTSRGNYQIDYCGTEHNVIANFEDYCIKNDVIWAHLFREDTGFLLRTFKDGELQ